jgi:hypothetical protein
MKMMVALLGILTLSLLHHHVEGAARGSASELVSRASSALRERENFETRAHAQLSRWCNATLPAQVSRRSALQQLLIQAQSSQSIEEGTGSSLKQLETEAAAVGGDLERRRLQDEASQSMHSKEMVSSKLGLDDATRDVEALQRAVSHLGGSGSGAKAVSDLLKQAQETKHQRQQQVLLLQSRSSSKGNLSNLEAQYRVKKADIVSYQHQFFTTQRSLNVLTSALEDEAGYLADLQSVCGAETRVHTRIESQVMPMLIDASKVATTEASRPKAAVVSKKPVAPQRVAAKPVVHKPKPAVHKPTAPKSVPKAVTPPKTKKMVGKPLTHAAHKVVVSKPKTALHKKVAKAAAKAAVKPKAQKARKLVAHKPSQKAPKPAPAVHSHKENVHKKVVHKAAAAKIAAVAKPKKHKKVHVAPPPPPPKTEDVSGDDAVDDGAPSPPPPAPKPAKHASPKAHPHKKVHKPKPAPPPPKVKEPTADDDGAEDDIAPPAPVAKPAAHPKHKPQKKAKPAHHVAPKVKDPFADDDDDSDAAPPAPVAKAVVHPAKQNHKKAKPAPAAPKTKDPFADDDEDDTPAPVAPKPAHKKPQVHKAKPVAATTAPKTKDPLADDDDDTPAPPPAPKAHSHHAKPAPPPPAPPKVKDPFADDDDDTPAPPPPPAPKKTKPSS